jgi:hypothetical protein
LYELKKLEEVSGTPQTQLTLTFQVNVGGRMPARLVSSKGKGVDQLSYMSVMRRHFDKSFEIDEANRASVVEMIKNSVQQYTEEENEIIEDGLSHFDAFKRKKSKKLVMDSPSTIAKIAFTDGDSHAWGWSTLVVRASCADVLSYACGDKKRSVRQDRDLEKSIDEAPNAHNKLVYYRKRMAKPFDDRDFLSRFVWKATEDGVFVYVSKAEESRKRHELPGVLRAKLPSVMKLTRISATATQVDYIVHPDARATLPRSITKSIVKALLNRVSDLQQFFQCMRTLSQYDADDGRAIGEILVIETREEKHHRKRDSAHAARMRDLSKKYTALREIGKKYAFFEDMMVNVLQNQLRPARYFSVSLCNVSAKEGRAIGSGLAISLASALTAQAAVDEWICKYPALVELDREEVWFRPMMNTVTFRLLGEVSWGLKARVFVGAGLSILDMASDIYMIISFLRTGDGTWFGFALLGMLMASVVMQLVIVILQNKGRPWNMLKGALIVLTGLKPGKQTYCLRCFAAVLKVFLFTNLLFFRQVLTHTASLVGPRSKWAK